MMPWLTFAETGLYSRRGDGLRPRLSAPLQAGEEFHPAGGAPRRDGAHLLVQLHHLRVGNN